MSTSGITYWTALRQMVYVWNEVRDPGETGAGEESKPL
jgi:hypothetical protein